MYTLTLAGAVVAALTTAGVGARSLGPEPLDAFAAILNACRTHRVVALSEEHGDDRSHQFRLALLRSPGFADVVSDLVVEFGNAQYQAVVDRYIDGHDVPYSTLVKVWQDTTQPHAIWDRPMYEQFFTSVRHVNEGRPQGRRLRVWLGDPPIDWRVVRDQAELRTWRERRGQYPAELVSREIVAKGRRALVIYGAAHLWHGGFAGPTLVDRIEELSHIRPFVVVAHPFANLRALGVRPDEWPVPRLGLTVGSSLHRQVDAVLYLGAGDAPTPATLPSALCEDRAYREMRLRRMTIAGRPAPAAEMARECGERPQEVKP